MTGSLRPLGRRLRALLHLDDPPRRIAAALAVGVFISCTPFWGLQTLLSIAVASAFRLNRAAAITGTWLNLPWFAPFVYGAAIKIGGLVVPDPGGMREAWLDFLLEHPRSLSWRDALGLLQEVSLPLLVGTTLVGLVAAVATYVVAVILISTRRRRLRAPPAGDGMDRRAIMETKEQGR
jgi:uncharacterized protein